MSRNYQLADSSEFISELTIHTFSQAISRSDENSFTCINATKASSNSWPIRKTFPVHEYPAIVPPTAHAPTVGSSFRESIMNHAQQLERSKKAPSVSGVSNQSRKRNPPDAAAQDFEVPQIKRLKTIKPNIPDTSKPADDSHLSTKTIRPPTSSTLSAKTMSKLNAFRFSATQSENCEKKSYKVEPEDVSQGQDRPNHETASTKPKYIMKDHSSRLIQSGREEMARLQETEPIDPYKVATLQSQNTGEHDAPVRETPKENPLHPQSRYKIKDHSSRLIQAGIDEMQKAQVCNAAGSTEDVLDSTCAPVTQYKMKDHASRLIKVDKQHLAIPAKQIRPVFPEDKVTRLDSAEMNDTMDNFDDLDNSIFDDASLDGFEFDEGTSTNTTEVTEMDDLDDSIFEQIIADDNANFQEAPSSAQPEASHSRSDSVSSPSRPGAMLPPKLPSPVPPSKNVSVADDRIKAAPNIPISPFIRSPGAVLVTSLSPIPTLHAAGRVVTCFRLAEMFRELSTPSPPSAIELFATVKASSRTRDRTSQSFTFADLFFPQRPPYVFGVYSKCSESELFDDDSRPFLKAGQGGKGILARAIVRPKPKSGKQLLWNQKNGFHASEGTSIAMEVEVLNIYVCPWEDIEYTKGIVMPAKEVLIKKEGQDEVFYKQEKKRKFSPLKPLGESAALKDLSSNLPSSPTMVAGSRK